MHERGLRFGIYEDYGNFTCAGYPGILNHMELDAKTFADWQVDYVKLDGCYAFPSQMDKGTNCFEMKRAVFFECHEFTGYPEFGYYLNRTGRPIVYSCSWPFYQLVSSMKVYRQGFS